MRNFDALVLSVGLGASAMACGNDGGATPSKTIDAGADSGDAAADGGDDAASGPGVIVTDRGPVVGRAQGSVTSFLGIPYAAPPIGDRRLKAPEPHAPWTTPLQASSFGAACPQGIDLTGASTVWDEDCLTLNVWSPEHAAGTTLPVMVFIHGGAFRNGSSNKPLYDGAALAALGRVVVVSMNYRLGALGFMAHSALSAEDSHGSSGNYGILDQQAALRWVHSNVRGFGGDPEKVTIFGESAGSMSVCVHLVSPLSAGLFRRGMGESGSCLYFTRPLRGAQASAETRGAAVAVALGCQGDDVPSCLRAKPASAFLDAEDDPSSDVGFAEAMPQPNIDGYVLSESPSASFVAGRFAEVDAFLAGTNADDATLFTRQKMIANETEYRAAIFAITPDHADDVLSFYPASGGAYGSAKAAYDAFITDFTFLCPTRKQLAALAARGVATYLYRFEKLTPFGRASGLGVYHAAELPFVFGNLSEVSGTSDAARALAASMGGYWTRFAAAGDPNGNQAASWPRFNLQSDAHLRIDDTSQAGSGWHAAECAAMTGWFAPPP
ncbi:MAG: carboxylesterase family protein [Polyangiaceae bacterium]